MQRLTRLARVLASLQAGGGGWNLSPTRQPLSAEQTVQRSQAESASTLDSVIHKLMLAEQVRFLGPQ